MGKNPKIRYFPLFFYRFPVFSRIFLFPPLWLAPVWIPGQAVADGFAGGCGAGCTVFTINSKTGFDVDALSSLAQLTRPPKEALGYSIGLTS